MALSKEQEDLYRKTMEEAKSQLETIDDEMAKEIQRARERLAKLQDSKRSFRQLYEGAARLLDIKIESDDQDKDIQQMTAGDDGIPKVKSGPPDELQPKDTLESDAAGLAKNPDDKAAQQA